ncbi:MAG: hypothetical protein WD032_09625 [Nitrospirales bacterium]
MVLSLLNIRNRLGILQIPCLTLWLMVWGCTGPFHGSLTAVPEDQSQQVLTALRQKENTIRTLRGLFQAAVSGSGIPFAQRFNGVMSYAKPDTVHLRGFLRFGVPMMDFHRKGNSYELYFPAKNEVIIGQVAGGVGHTQWDQTVQLSIRALDAVLGKIAGLSTGEVRVLKGETHYRLDMATVLNTVATTQENFQVRSWIDAHTLELVAIEYRTSEDDVVVSVECEDYREVNGPAVSGQGRVRLPFVVKATDHRSSGGSITLNFQEFILNAV